MDEFERRMNLKGVHDSIIATVTAFNPNLLVADARKSNMIEDEYLKKYSQRWLNMAMTLLSKAEEISLGQADYLIRTLGIEVKEHAKEEQTSGIV